MKLQILQDAQDELNSAIAYYEEVETGLGLRLKEEARDIIQWIAENPELPRLRAKGYRRVNFKVFQHYVAYFIWAETIWIVAISHGRRRPEFWLKRKKRIG